MLQKNKIRVLVTSAGTASAISVIKALKKQEQVPVIIYATDMDPMAAGLFLADHYFISPAANSKEYIPTLVAALQKHEIKAVIPIYSKEIRVIAEHAAMLSEVGGGTFLPDPKTIDLCNDKIAIAAVLQNTGIRLPVSYATPSDVPSDAYPVFFKPNFSSSSAGAQAVDNRTDLERIYKASPGGIIQQLIKGKEVTVDIFCDASSNPMVIAPRIRLAVKSGQTVKGETIDPQPFGEAVKKICALVKMKGVCNIQFFVTGNELIFLEINPRFAAGGLMLTVASGANIPLLVLKSILGLTIRHEECITTPGVKMTRFWEEIII